MIRWIKSSYSDSANSCVEVAWMRAEECTGGDCIDVARAGAVILVADSKLGDLKLNQAQAWSVDEWQELLRAIRLAGRESQPQHVALDFPDSGSVGHLRFGLDRHETLHFDFDEWRAFRDGVLAGEFEPESLSAPVAANSDSPAGRVDAETREGASAGEVVQTFAAGQPGPQAGPPPVNPSHQSAFLEARHDHDPTSNPASRVLPEAAHSIDDASLIWTEDPTLGEPQEPGVDKGAARRAGQGPVFADRSGVEAAGTGARPPASVPVADDSARAAARAAVVALYERDGCKLDDDDDFCRGELHGYADAAVDAFLQATWAQAIAPLGLRDGAR